MLIQPNRREGVWKGGGLEGRGFEREGVWKGGGLEGRGFGREGIWPLKCMR